MGIKATVILPTFGRADFIRESLESARRQTVEEIEIFAVCDGSAAETREILRDAARLDKRIRIFEHEKGPRNGESYRHQALLESQGEIVCYLGHDDLWFPRHVEVMLDLLSENDFAQSLFTYVSAEGQIKAFFPLIADPLCRKHMARFRFNRFGPTCAAHTRKIYFSLPHGWRPAPGHIWSDLYMWRQFIELPVCRFAGHPETTALVFPQLARTNMSLSEREVELKRWYSTITVPGEERKITSQALQAAASSQFEELLHKESVIYNVMSRQQGATRPRPSAVSLLLARLLRPIAGGRSNLLAGLKGRLARAMVASSGLFNHDFYHKFYSDLDTYCGDLVRHYLDHGWLEGKSPSPDFDSSNYLILNQDVWHARINPLVHYILFGYWEKRPACGLFDTEGVRDESHA